jgi:hypothetical protein
MTIFWQHVGKLNSQRDFPLTIGQPNVGLKQFRSVYIEEFIQTKDPHDDLEIQRNFGRIGNSPFQIWGFPAGAAGKIDKLKRSDLILLLDTDGEGGKFCYIGKCIFKLPSTYPELSQALWGDPKFPIIVLLLGHLINYPWLMFLRDFQYGPGLKPMGRTHTISDEALLNSEYADEAKFYQSIVEKFTAA